MRRALVRLAALPLLLLLLRADPAGGFWLRAPQCVRRCRRRLRAPFRYHARPSSGRRLKELRWESTLLPELPADGGGAPRPPPNGTDPNLFYL